MQQRVTVLAVEYGVFHVRFLQDGEQFRIVVALILPAEQEYRFPFHTPDRFYRGVYVLAFGVVYIRYAVYFADKFYAVFYALELRQSFRDIRVFHSHDLRRGDRCERVLHVMQSLGEQFARGNDLFARIEQVAVFIVRAAYPFPYGKPHDFRFRLFREPAHDTVVVIEYGVLRLRGIFQYLRF